jgi:hypothetical protein
MHRREYVVHNWLSSGTVSQLIKFFSGKKISVFKYLIFLFLRTIKSGIVWYNLVNEWECPLQCCLII